MRANRLLVRSQFGWTYEEHPTSTADVIEGLLEVGALPSEAEVSRQAQAQLARYGEDQTQTTVAIEPADLTESPGHGFVEGDTVVVDGVTERVVAWTLSRENDRRPKYTIEVGAHIPGEDERVNNQLRQMVDGTFRGDAAVASPVPERIPTTIVPTRVVLPQVFDRDASTSATESKPWTVPTGFTRAIEVTVDLSAIEGSDVDVTLRVNGVDEETVTVPAGDTTATEAGLTIAVTRGDVLTVYSADVGFDLVVTVRLA